jgi:ParB family chromosome partitioning protein
MLYRQILRYDFTVRKIEEIVREFSEKKSEEKARGNRSLPDNLKSIKEKLEVFFPVPVKLSAGEGGKGKITISYRSENELLEIVKLIENQK